MQSVAIDIGANMYKVQLTIRLSHHFDKFNFNAYHSRFTTPLNHAFLSLTRNKYLRDMLSFVIISKFNHALNNTD